MDKLPIYRFLVPENDDEIGVSAVALVDYPAIEMNWQAFSANQYQFKADTEKRIISGPLMVAELPIYALKIALASYFLLVLMHYAAAKCQK